MSKRPYADYKLNRKLAATVDARVEEFDTFSLRLSDSGAMKNAMNTIDLRSVQVSMFQGVTGGKPTDVGLLNILNDVRSGRYASQIIWLRSLGEIAYKREKKKLAAFTVSGTCADRKTQISHSNLLQIDFDDVDDVETLRVKLQTDPHIAFVYVSPSGEGLKAAIAIDGNRHADSFESAEYYFRKNYDFIIDPSVKDKLRICFVSHDPAVFVNERPRILPLTQNNLPLHRVEQSNHRAPLSKTELTESTKSTEVTEAIGGGGEFTVFTTIKEVVAASIPKSPGSNNAAVFKLARGLVALDKHRPVTLTDRIEAFNQWYEQATALGLLRNKKQHYLTEFMNAVKTAKIPLRAPPQDAAWRRVQKCKPPAEAKHFDCDKMKQLVSLCFQLHQASKGAQWYLSCRDAERLIGVPYRTCNQWLNGFVALGLLEVVLPGTKKLATRFKWKGGTS